MSVNEPLDLVKLRAALARGRLEWRKHALQRMAERGITQAAALQVIQSGEPVEHDPRTFPYPSALFLDWVEGRPLHVVAALDEEYNWAYMITTYEPDLEHFEPDYRTRRSP